MFLFKLLTLFFFLPLLALANPPKNLAGKQLKINDYVHLQWRELNNQQFPSIFDLAQDSKGFIWLATYDGLIRFDGVNFTRMLSSQDDDIFHKYISHIEIEHNDTVWFVPFNTGLARLENGILTRFTINDGLLCDTINEIAYGPNGKLWYACDQGIGFYHNGRFYQYASHNGSEITALLIESDQLIWFGNVNGELYRLKDGKKTVWRTADGLPQSNIQAIFRHTDDSILIGNRNEGVFQLKNNQISQTGKLAQTSHLAIDDIISDKFGALWLGTNKGIVRITEQDSNIEIKLLGFNALEGARGKALLTDKQGNIWAGFYAKGLHQLIYPKINVISAFDDIFYAVRCVAEYQNAYWIGTDNGGITIKHHNGKTEQLTTKDGLLSNTIHVMFSDNQGAMWIGSVDGLSRYDKGKLTHFNLATLGLSNTITSISQMKDDSIWIGTMHGIAVIPDSKSTEIKAVGQDYDRTAQRIRWINQVQDGSIWAGTYDGVIIYRNEQWQQPPYSELNSKSQRSFHQDQDGGMWFGSLVGEGLTWLKDGQIRQFNTKDGLFDNYMWTIAEDKLGYLWMLSDKGISRVKRQDLENYHDRQGRKRSNKPLNVTTLGEYEGLEVSECNGSSPGYAHTKANKIIFPCMVGLVEIDPNNIHIPNNSPTNVIDYITSNNQRQWQLTDVKFAPEQRDFTLHYTAIGYDNPDKIQFRYRLKGYNDDWQLMQTRRNVSFTNLSSGQYQFELDSRFYNGQWGNNPAILSFTIDAYFYETWWFISSTIVLLLMLSYQVYRYRINKVVKTIKQIDDAKIEYLGKLVSNIAHNLNQPITTAIERIDAQPNKLKRLNIDEQSEQKLLQHNQEIKQHLKKVAKMIALFKQLNIDNTTDEMEDIDLDHLINTVKIDTDINHPNRIIDWQINKPSDLTLFSYPHILAQILNTLVDNSLTHGYSKDQHARITIRFSRTANIFSIIYQDFGKGINTEQQQDLFIPFNQATEHAKGLGLGMNKVYNLVTHRLNGEITLESSEEQGVCFTIHFPL